MGAVGSLGFFAGSLGAGVVAGRLVAWAKVQSTRQIAGDEGCGQSRGPGVSKWKLLSSPHVPERAAQPLHVMSASKHLVPAAPSQFVGPLSPLCHDWEPAVQLSLVM